MPCSISPGQQDKINRETKAEMLTRLEMVGFHLIARLNGVSLNPLTHRSSQTLRQKSLAFGSIVH